MPPTIDPVLAHVSPASHIASGTYNPYNGREALDLIMKRIYNELKDHQDFANHLAYTRFTYSFELKFQPEAIESTVIKGRSQEGPKLRAESTHEVKGSSPGAPDDGRREAGLFVPTTTLTSGGLVDIPLQSQLPHVPNRP